MEGVPALREVGILDGILSLVHSSFTLGSSPTAQQLHVLLHRLTQFIHFLGARGLNCSLAPPCPQILTALSQGLRRVGEVLKLTSSTVTWEPYLFKKGEQCLLWFIAETLYIL